jgi:hypothetical protein
MQAKKRCFVISPIDNPGTPVREHADLVFKTIITEALKGFFDDTVRSDHLGEYGRLSDSIFRHIGHDDLCIALMTGGNRNVCYEVGIAKAHGTPLVLLLQEGEKLPSDLADERTVMYQDGEPEVSVRKLRLHLNDLRDKGWTVPSIIPGATSRVTFTHNVFISVPMTSMPKEYQEELRSKALQLKGVLEKRGVSCYTAAERIMVATSEGVEGLFLARRRDLEALRTSKHYVLLHPAPVASSVLAEAGYALAMRKPSFYLCRCRADLPFMLQEASDYPVHITEYDDRDFLKRCVEIADLLESNIGHNWN